MARRISPQTVNDAKHRIVDLRSSARTYTKLCLTTLSGIVRSPKHNPQARVAAASVLLDRGWGKAPQTHEIEANHAINIIIRKVLDEPDDDAVLIEGVVSDKTQRGE